MLGRGPCRLLWRYGADCDVVKKDFSASDVFGNRLNQLMCGLHQQDRAQWIFTKLRMRGMNEGTIIVYCLEE